MKKVIRKTTEEMEEAVTTKEIKLGDTHYFYFVCENCKVAFFTDDIILKSSDGTLRCPNKINEIGIKSLFFKKTFVCGEQMYGGDEETFNKYYKYANS